MGTSTSNSGTSGGGTPLVPSWLQGVDDGVGSIVDISPSEDVTEKPIDVAPVQQAPESGDPNRYIGSRSSFSRFATSGGKNRSNLGRAVAGYISRSSGGAKGAALRMGASRPAAGKIVSVLSDISRHGISETLKSLNLRSLEGRSFKEILVGLADYITPEGGDLDVGIARAAYFEMIDDLEGNGITDFDNLNSDQIEIVLEMYMARSIEDRLYNEIGTNFISYAPTISSIDNIMEQVHDFVENGVSNAVSEQRIDITSISRDEIAPFIDKLYEQSFNFLQTMGNQLGDQE